MTFHASYDPDDQGGFCPSHTCNVWCHVPNGNVVPDSRTFISPIQVLGKDHPVSLVSERIGLLGDVLQFAAVDLQRRFDWLETAQANNMPLRTILYTNEASCCLLNFNLFSKSEADRLALGVRLVPMTEKCPEIHEVMQSIQYELPMDSSGCPVPPEQLLLEILDEDDYERGDEEVPPPAPVEDRQRFRRMGRHPVGTGLHFR